MMTSNSSTLASRAWTVLRVLNVRLRFIFLMVLVGVVAANWERLQNYYDRWRRPAETPETVHAQEIEFYCPMHPNIVRSETGNCPICGMPLAKRAKGARGELAEGVLAQVQLSPQKVRLGNIATTAVQTQLLSREIRTVGIVDYDETRRAFVAARIKGRLDKLFVNYVGQRMRKGEPLAWIYSPNLLIAQEEVLDAARQANAQPGVQPAPGMGKSLLDAARRKLTLWGITDAQVDEIIARGTAESHLTILSPIEGIVTEKKVLEGAYVDEGTDLFTIADLSRVWMQTKVFEDQISGVTVGTAVEVTSVAYPNEIFAGQITFIAYTVDPTTRTVAARVEISNPDLKLKPGMFASATIRLPVGRVVQTTTSAPVPTSGPATDGVAKSYIAMTEWLAKDKADTNAASHLSHEAQKLAQQAPDPIKSPASVIARLAKEMAAENLEGQRGILKELSAKTIELLRAAPPADSTLFTVHCPMVKADWLQMSEEVANPYYGSEMLRCGRVTGQIRFGMARHDGEFVQGYYCPVFPDRLFDEPRECPIDKFPLKFARVEKVLAIPASAVVNTGTRTVVYLENAPGTYDMLEVRLGPKAGEFFPVLSGLKAGDRVVTAGAFVVDAENRLNPAAAVQYFGASDTKNHHGEHGGHGE